MPLFASAMGEYKVNSPIPGLDLSVKLSEEEDREVLLLARSGSMTYLEAKSQWLRKHRGLGKWL